MMRYVLSTILFFVFCALFFAWNEAMVLPGYAARNPRLMIRPVMEQVWNLVYMGISFLFFAGALYSASSFVPQLEEIIQLMRVDSFVSGQGNPAEVEQIEVGSKMWGR